MRTGTDLKYASTVRRAPGVQQIVLACADKPLSAVGEFERQHAAVMQVKLVFVRLGMVQHFDVAVLHSETQATT